MANEKNTGASEILAIREAQKYPISPEARAVFDTSKGLTEQLYTQDVLRNFGGQAPAWVSAELQPETPTIPTMDVILDALKDQIKDDPKKAKGARTREQKFLEDFPKKQAEWKKAIVSNPQFGERGWEFVKEAWKAASIDKMYADMAKERTATLRGEREEGWKSIPAQVGGFSASVFRPREWEAYGRGEEPTWKDYIGDIAETGLMAVPGTSYVGGASRVIGAVPKVGPMVANVIAKNRAIANILGNAVAPVTGEALDAAMYGEGDPNIERQDFSAMDALLGTLTNMGVNYRLFRDIGGGGRVATGELTRGSTGGIRGRVRDLIESFGKTRAERGLPAPTTRAGRVLELLEMGAPTEIVNRIGRDADAQMALASLAGRAGGLGASLVGAENIDLTKEVPLMREREHQAMRDRATASQILKIEQTDGDLTERDKDYLKAVRENPGVMKFGYVPDESAEKKGRSSDDFNLWLLEKGHKLLRGTGAARSFAEIGRYE